MFKRFLPAIIIIIFFAAVGAGAYFLFGGKMPSVSLSLRGSPPKADNQSNPAGDLSETFQPAADSGDNFTIQYPKNFTQRQEDLGDGATRYIFESSEPQKGFEITVVPFDEQGPLTEERIRQDIPDIAMENTHNIVIASDIQAISFDSTDENIGDTHEVWYVASGKLFEARTYRAFGPAMEEVLKTLRFK